MLVCDKEENSDKYKQERDTNKYSNQDARIFNDHKKLLLYKYFFISIPVYAVMVLTPIGILSSMKTLFRTMTTLFLVSSCVFVFATTATSPNTTKSPKNFWANGYQAQWVSQTQSNSLDEYFTVKPGSVLSLEAKFKNTGNEIWYNSPEDRQVCIAIYKDATVQSSWTDKDKKGVNFGKSEFKATNWQSDYRIGCIQDTEVKPGETGTFVLDFYIPEDAPVGNFREDITLASGPFWMESVKATADPLGAAHIWVGLHIIDSAQSSVTPILQNSPTPTTSLESYVVDLLNIDRASQGVGPLVLDATLTGIAYDHTRDQGDNLHTISHVGSNGSTLSDRLAVGNARYTTAGENVGWTMGINDTNEALSTIEGLFFNETPPNDGHRKNILNAQYTRVGIGIYKKGSEVYVTQDFAG